MLLDNPIIIKTADGNNMYATHEGQLTLSQLPTAARRAYIVPELANKSLLSIAQLCKAGCTVQFDKDRFEVQYEDRIVLTGSRQPNNGLYQVDDDTAATMATECGQRNTPANQKTALTATVDNAPADTNQVATVPDTPAPAAPQQYHYHYHATATASPATATNTHTATEGNESTPANLEHIAATARGISTPAETVKFMHAAFGYPVIKTLINALDKGYIHGVPGLSSTMLRRYPPYNVATAKGHMAQSRSNQRSTKPKNSPKTKQKPEASGTNSAALTIPETPLPTKPLEPIIPGQEQYNIFQVDDGGQDDCDDNNCAPTTTTGPTTEEYCYSTIHQPSDRSYSDQTGKFIVESTVGNNYLFILYDQGSNNILAEPIPNRKDKSITTAFTKLHDTLTQAGSRPRMHIVDNECGQLMKQAFQERNLAYQLVPPGVHRRNAAERAIRTYKDHLIAILSGTDRHFPLHLWDKLIPQATMTLNLMRPSRINPKHSAYSQINGPYLYNNTPIAPLGSQVLVHVKPHERTTWSPRGEEAFYIGPALNHYRCYNFYITSSRDFRISDTVSWAPSNIRAPTFTNTDVIVNAITELTTAIQQPMADSTETMYTESHIPELRQLARFYQQQPTASDGAGEMRVTTERKAPPTTTTDAGEMRVDGIILPPVPPSIPVPKPTTAAIPSTHAEYPTFHNSSGVEGQKRRKESKRRKRPPKKLRSQHATFAFILEHNDETNETHVALHTAICNIGISPEEYALHGHAINPDTGGIAEYNELIKCSQGPLWLGAMADEIGRLMNGHDTLPVGTNTMKWVRYYDIPKHYVPTYCRIVCADRPEKANRYRVRLTVGGDRVEYNGNASTKTCDIIVVKLLLNSTISTPNARFATIDIKDFYLNTTMSWDDRVYMRIPVSQVPPKIIAFYNLLGMVHKGYLYVEITKGMYGLKQAGKLANEQLTVHLAKYGYIPCNITAGLWRHTTRDIIFTLVVDDFGVRYTKLEDFQHLKAALEDKYQISIDMSGTKYCGMAIKWDYEALTCDISMPGYIERALARFQHETPARQQHAPHPWQQPDYGARTQLTAAPDESAKLGKKEITRIQEILGTLLYYARAIDSTMLTAISSLSSEQASGTENTMKKITHLLNYCATHPDAVIRYHRSDMVLHVESDASYLSETRARSRAAGYFYLSRAPTQAGQAPAPADSAPPINGAITILCNIMREVVSSAAEAELAALFYNAREAVSIRIALDEMGHPQPATPIVTDNSTAAGIVNDTVRQRRSKAIDMRFYWVRDRTRIGEFTIYWKKGSLNRADYFSKHHPGKHHTEIRPIYIHTESESPNDEYLVATLAYLHIRHSAGQGTTNDDDDDNLYRAYITVQDFLALLSHGIP